MIYWIDRLNFCMPCASRWRRDIVRNLSSYLWEATHMDGRKAIESGWRFLAGANSKCKYIICHFQFLFSFYRFRACRRRREIPTWVIRVRSDRSPFSSAASLASSKSDVILNWSWLPLISVRHLVRRCAMFDQSAANQYWTIAAQARPSSGHSIRCLRCSIQMSDELGKYWQ